MDLAGSGVRGRKVARVAILAALVAAPLSSSLAAIPARAQTCGPQNGSYPNNPGYAPAENGVSGQTWDNEQWYLYGCIPQDAALSSDPEGAAGMSIDRVWNELHNKGNDQVLVSYMEGGVNWRIDASCSLKDRAWLNRGELPYPEHADGSTKTTGDRYDLNNDGVFNVEDYIDDPRVKLAVTGLHKSPAGGDFLHHVCDKSLTGIDTAKGGTDITPEDLIVAFGHCHILAGQITGGFPCDSGKHFDNDGNGYANDINGWNFNRDTNDPQTEQSIYHHFDGESAQAIGEADNKFGNAGLCPKCRYVPIKAGDEAIDRPDRIAEAIVYAADIGVKVFDGTTAAFGLTNSVKSAIDYGYHKGMVFAWASNDFESADHTDGMFYPHTWPGNSITGDYSTRNGATCPASGPFCLFVKKNTTFRSRASLTSYGPHALFSVPNNDGSTSTGIPTQAGVAALVFSEAYNDNLNPMLSSDEVKQVVRSTASYIGTLSSCSNCFQGIDGATFNIQYGYGRPNVFKAGQAVDAGHIPPTADIRTPDWYQEVDPTRQSTLHVAADVAAARAGGGAYTWELQYGLGPQPLDNQWTTFASGAGAGPSTVAGDIDLTQAALQSFAAAAYSIDPVTRLTIEQYDVTVRVHVFANGDKNTAWKMGEDRRAFHLRHDTTEHAGFPVRINSSGDSSPVMADIEGRGWLDTILGTADGTVHAFRPDGSEAPGFPVYTGPARGVSPSADVNYLNSTGWQSGQVVKPREGIFAPVAVGDLRHDGGLEIVVGTDTGYTYVWDGAGHLMPGFPVLNGSSGYWHMSVPPPDTPYSFEPENITGGAPVLADLEKNGKLDIIVTAGDNRVHAWRPDGSAVPGWPVSTILPPGTVPGGAQLTHDSKIVPTAAVADINGDGIPDVVVGLDDTILGTGPGGAGVKAFLLAFDGRGLLAGGSVPGNPALLPGYPAQIQGLIQGYGVAQDFVTQGVESPVIYDSPQGPQAVVNANLFLPYRVDLKTATPSNSPFAPTVIPAGTPQDCAPAGLANVAGTCSMVQFTTSASIGNVLGLPVPQVFQAGSSSLEVVLGITETPGFGIRVENGIGGWDPTSGASLPQFSHYLQGLAFFSAPAIADVTGDGTPDVIQSADSAALMAFDGVTGQPAAGFPKWSGGWSLWSPAVGDLSGSGTVAVAAATREGYLHIWDTPGKTNGNNQAWHWHQDDRNTGHYGTDTRPPSAIRDLVVTRSGANDTLTFTAPGDDWNYGTAAKYVIKRSSGPITQDNWGAATLVSDPPPKTAGSQESISVPHVDGADYYAVRAIDKAGNIAPLVVQVDAAVTLSEHASNRGIPATSTQAPVSPAAGLVLLLALVALRILRRARSAREELV